MPGKSEEVQQIAGTRPSNSVESRQTPDVRTSTRARISELSRTGCYAEMLSPFPLGDLVKMRIMKNKTSFLAQAEVTNTSFWSGSL